MAKTLRKKNVQLPTAGYDKKKRTATSFKSQKQHLREWLAHGVKFIPVARAGKVPLGGFSSRNYLGKPEDAARLWANYPDCNYGLITGPDSGIFVLDVDGPEGRKSLKALREKLGPLHPTVEVVSGNGLHYYFKWHDGIRNSTAKLGPGLDVRGDGGYVVGPGSVHENGKKYQYRAKRGLADKPIAEAPEWLLALLLPADPVAVSKPHAVIGEGGRNSELTKLGGKLVRSGLSRETINATLQAHNLNHCDPPLDAAEVINIVASVCRYAAGSVEGDPAEMLAEIVLRENFDGGNTLLRAEDSRFWTYTGKYWTHLPKEDLKNTVWNQLQSRRELLGKTGTTASLLKQTVELLEARAFRKNDPLDFKGSAKRLINLDNGELHIDERGGIELRGHRPESYLRNFIDVTYDPTATCPMFDTALQQIFASSDDRDDLVRYIHEFIGYTLQPSRQIPIIAIWQGSGSNGKSSLSDLMVTLLGTDQVAALRVKDISHNQFSSNALFGKLLLLDDDVQSGTRLPDGDLKRISENKLISAEIKNGPSYTFYNRAFPLLLCNNAPSVADLSNGLLRRMHVVPFKHKFEEDRIDRTLFDRIKSTELSGVLNRALSGLERLIKRGWHFDQPKSMRTAQQAWLRQANPLPDFIEQCCRHSGSYLVRDLYRLYEDWCKANGITYVKQSGHFKRDLQSLNFNIRHSRDGEMIYGLSPRGPDGRNGRFTA